jgi:DUF4097 and DUF4098 domain-containing protein YvlB
MMFATTAVLISALTMAQAPPRDTRAAQTDQTIQVTKGTRLSVQNFAGEVIVRTWDKDALRVQARHSARMRVSINTPAGAIAITSGESTGSVDYEISAPEWMPIKIEGTYNFVTVEGSRAEVFAENVRGDIVIKGGTGLVTARTIEGVLIVEGARGKINLNAVNEGIRVNGASGEIIAETTNGDIALTGIESASVDVVTVNGDVTYEGTLAERGHYRFSSHNGDLVMTVPATVNATFIVRSYQGDFRTALPVKGPPRGEVRQGRRNSYTLGSGSAQVELESFGGDIRLREPGGSDPAKTKEKEK